jgi:hypothetical protein
MSLGELLSDFRVRLQDELFPKLEEGLRSRLSPFHKDLVTVLAFVRVEALLPHWHGLPGRPPSERAALARAFLAKAVFNLPTTALLREILLNDGALRRICGWQRAGEVPSEATFSRAFAEFARSGLAERLHGALIAATLKDRLVGHISRDSTAIDGRERPQKPAAQPAAAPPEPPRKRGRPRKDAPPAPPKPERRLVRQLGMSLRAMLDDLPRACDRGAKRNAKGHLICWTGYKLHIDTADGGIPVSCILTSASLHDSQAAIPLATLTAGRVTNCYDLMDSAYEAAEIRQHSQALGHVPIIDANPRGEGAKQREADEAKIRKALNFYPAEAVRYRERTTAERVNSDLKDNHGGRFVRVRGAAKVMSHLMFGVVSLTVLNLVRLTI